MYYSKMSLNILCIGDPHFKADNALETELMETQLRNIITMNNYDFVVVLGDTFHTNERLNLYIQKRVVSFFKMLKDVAKEVYILVGNHDRPNNNIFMTDEHPFTSMKEWGEKFHVIDTTETFIIDGSTFIFVPYVPTGRLVEALQVGGHEAPYSDASCIFMHQEILGCQMGAIISEHGDKWESTWPLAISGHIHDYSQLLPNMIYPGTPIQHNYCDRADKSLSVFTFIKEGKHIMTKHERLRMDIPKKLILKLTPEELLLFKLTKDAKVKIKVMGTSEVLRNLMLTDHVKDLQAAGVKIDICKTRNPDLELNSGIPNYKVKTSFQTRLLDYVHKDTSLKETFEYLFPSMKITK
jgi:DNA repair exonuclease SbcCD nuclease subunit